MTSDDDVIDAIEVLAVTAAAVLLVAVLVGGLVARRLWRRPWV